ncbi:MULTISPECIES: outer membrane beta-barrel protein [unclassified Lentimicrobium]|uniref:outer membrane beta-barrel protein n=1 Tax=unclassified Lentimicrobium TaxID=2677434 RepID=UPI0015577F9D|nr:MULTISPECIES: outer membrane beta-barrel protein [unclassified Lentimicrobium]NPD44835.1 outer membrane beta-barrel protein [Lentimicrobium sp. S6]NPD83148.1 outer membrane beta-barrel protein [Lentimicrobium sp. L6]
MKSKISQKALLIITFLLMISGSSMAQRSFDTHKGGMIWKHWYVQANIGLNLFYGDVSSHDQDLFKKIGEESSFAYSLTAGKWITDWGGAEFTFSSGKLIGSTPGLQFENNYNQYIIQGIFNFTQLLYPANEQTPFYIYGKIGYGQIDFNSVLRNSSTLDTIKMQGKETTHGKRVSEWVLPLCLGGAFNLDENLTIVIDGTLFLVNSDKLDARFGKNGNDDNDFYVNFSVGLRYTFNAKETQGSFNRSKSRRSNRWSR